MKHESSLGEACAVSPYPSAEPPQTCTQALGSQSPSGAPCPSWSPGAGGRPSSCLAQVRRHGLPRVSPGAWGLQGLRETTLWEPRGQAGGAMEDGSLRPWETGSWGRRLCIRSPAELINQCKKASGNQLVFIELKSVEHNVERGRWP